VNPVVLDSYGLSSALESGLPPGLRDRAYVFQTIDLACSEAFGASEAAELIRLRDMVELQVVSMTSTITDRALELYGLLRARLAFADCACLALAVTKAWAVATPCPFVRAEAHVLQIIVLSWS
jgi:hypothetical protein